MSDRAKRPEPVQRKEVPGAPRQTTDSRKGGTETPAPVFDDWALI